MLDRFRHFEGFSEKFAHFPSMFKSVVVAVKEQDKTKEHQRLRNIEIFSEQPDTRQNDRGATD